MVKKITVGVIGAGYWGPNLVRNFLLVDDCSVKHVCDLDMEKLRKLERLYPHINFTTRASDIFSDKEVDAVAIATPVATHFGLAKKALENGKHVFVEKPITKTSGEAKELIALAKKKRRILHVDHTFIYYGPVIKIKEIIDSGALGDLYYFDSQRINLGLIQKDVNVFWDLAAHDLSILQYIYKFKADTVSASATRHAGKNKEELAHLSVEYSNGFVAHLHVSWLSPVKMRQILIAGSKKMIYFDDIEPSEKIKVYSKNIDFVKKTPEDPANPVYRSGDVLMPIYDDEEALLKECAHFVASVRDGKNTITDGTSGLKVVEILEAADRSVLKRGAKVKI
ncbi:MAG: oxidoreductase [Candidatus Taylorbacteria bacterium RIFCSPLOWO2_12_FULL_43_20]|uniref:Oxidoreductase n=1 Tax=Candidatus Taylorbacteria bacterium RIFCSPLOWO2_12_FULL_43_20 TaxID=1802332 RepID=A0A1G2P2R0_9BACT|nr:MAG: oxidoreductase [Candidatus Taylorbacteria bacterium RIFCSPHIGHO2_01_FULL_43_120]OHA22400.1 MAG: oxidoreductase [Candidatus Taylorbacteria bacterium RIFCSPHIGHO2_02_FULL_43_55]OHA28339.1 MAG: oxidoreductase [Candidatus Taylorbacteria bacterium RIFCSPHIGHO2_12_FULL_42_34]OHA30613.1 MAG: oxidoreductase [Candidatus Taylorbacteria bacterium RIFCSPLOWO2_01_FULL_43_83]OHA38510.1 MAG: oxidoreductase [Candidatus Taylorbacteria bacterium RIFCSPLOWO2_02_FULL_43_22b]OHA41861.1 MAG: oxidoreductase 